MDHKHNRGEDNGFLSHYLRQLGGNSAFCYKLMSIPFKILFHMGMMMYIQCYAIFII